MLALIIGGVAAFALLIGVPIAYVILIACFMIIAADPFVSLAAVPSIFVQGMDSFILLSIPLFVLVGVIMNAGGISQRLLDQVKVSRRDPAAPRQPIFGDRRQPPTDGSSGSGSDSHLCWALRPDRGGELTLRGLEAMTDPKPISDRFGLPTRWPSQSCLSPWRPLHPGWADAR